MDSESQGIPANLNAITNQVAKKYNQDAKYNPLFSRPLGDDGSGFFSNDPEQSANFVAQNTPPGVENGYLQSFMQNQGWADSRQNKVLDILRPTTATTVRPQAGQIVGGYVFLGGDPNDQNSYRPAQ